MPKIPNHKTQLNENLKELTIYCGVRTSPRTLGIRRSYWFAIEKGRRIAGDDFDLSRTLTREGALRFAHLKAQEWQLANQLLNAQVVFLRPDGRRTL
jgi:hypothetical protein